jgi:hypothetical protein
VGSERKDSELKTNEREKDNVRDKAEQQRTGDLETLVACV